MKQVREVEKPKYDERCPCKVTTMGHITEVLTFQKPTVAPPIQKLTKDLYCYLPTGEVLEYEHDSTSRADNIKNVRRTMANIRALVNTNVTTPENCLWCTFTYAENMTDTKRLYEDWRRFWQRFAYWCKQQGYKKPEYITVQEPQGRGAWHVHCFFIWDTKAPFIPNNEVMEVLWGHGFTKTKGLQDIDNIGAYFSAYLADMPLEEYDQLPKAMQAQLEVVEKSFENAENLTKTKKFVKGGRLPMYPVGMNIVRKTKGIKSPNVERMTLKEAQKKVSPEQLTFSRSFEIVGENGEVVNTLTKSFYNSRR